MKKNVISVFFIIFFFVQSFCFTTNVFSQFNHFGPKSAPILGKKQQDVILKVSDGKIDITMEDVDLREFIRSMSKLLKKNFIITKKIKGKVSIISPKPVSRTVAYSIFESVLDVHGYKVIASGDIYKIVESRGVKTQGVDTHYGMNINKNLPADQVITQVLPLKYIDAKDILASFQPLVSKAGYLTAHIPSNTVILTDRVSNVNRLKKILVNIDVKGSKSQIYLFSLKFADVEAIVNEFMPLFQRGNSKGIMSHFSPKIKSMYSSKGRYSAADGTIIVPDKRTNSLIVSCNPEAKTQIEHLISLLDIKTPRVRDRIRVYYLNNAIAEDLADVLKKQVASTRSRRTKRREPIKEPLLQNVNINADKATNSLVITASPEDFEILSDVIKKLDVRRAQVLVESLILETSLDKTRDLGVEWRSMDAPSSDKVNLIGGTNLPVGTQATGALNQMGTDPNPYSSGMPAGLVLGAIKGPVYWGKNAFFTLGALARALRADTDVNILLTPHIVTYDNKESEIIVGEERPYLKSSQTSAEGSIIRTFEFKDVGTTLRITPHISQGNSIRLDIFIEIKNFVEQVDIGAITTTKRQVKTSVQVEDGRMVVLGGIIKEDARKSSSMIPCLGKIWGLGWLFRAQKNQNQKTNLLIFINPRILKSEAAMEKITSEKRNQYKEKTGTDIPPLSSDTKNKEKTSTKNKTDAKSK